MSQKPLDPNKAPLTKIVMTTVPLESPVLGNTHRRKGVHFSFRPSMAGILEVTVGMKTDTRPQDANAPQPEQSCAGITVRDDTRVPIPTPTPELQKRPPEKAHLMKVPDECLDLIFGYLDSVCVQWHHWDCLRSYFSAMVHFHPRNSIQCVSTDRMLAFRREDNMTMGVLQKPSLVWVTEDTQNQFRVQTIAPISFICRRFARLRTKSVLTRPTTVWVDSVDEREDPRTVRQRGIRSFEVFARDADGKHRRILVSWDRHLGTPFVTDGRQSIQRWEHPPPIWSDGYRFGEAKNPGPPKQRPHGSLTQMKERMLRCLAPLVSGDHEFVDDLVKRIDFHQRSFLQVIGNKNQAKGKYSHARHVRRWFLENYVVNDEEQALFYPECVLNVAGRIRRAELPMFLETLQAMQRNDSREVGFFHFFSNLASMDEETLMQRHEFFIEQSRSTSTSKRASEQKTGQPKTSQRVAEQRTGQPETPQRVTERTAGQTKTSTCANRNKQTKEEVANQDDDVIPLAQGASSSGIDYSTLTTTDTTLVRVTATPQRLWSSVSNISGQSRRRKTAKCTIWNHDMCKVTLAPRRTTSRVCQDQHNAIMSIKRCTMRISAPLRRFWASVTSQTNNYHLRSFLFRSTGAAPALNTAVCIIGDHQVITLTTNYQPLPPGALSRGRLVAFGRHCWWSNEYDYTVRARLEDRHVAHCQLDFNNKTPFARSPYYAPAPQYSGKPVVSIVPVTTHGHVKVLQPIPLGRVRVFTQHAPAATRQYTVTAVCPEIMARGRASALYHEPYRPRVALPPHDFEAITQLDAHTVARLVLHGGNPPPHSGEHGSLDDVFPLHWTFLEDVDNQCTSFARWVLCRRVHRPSFLQQLKELLPWRSHAPCLEQLLSDVRAELTVGEVFLVVQSTTGAYTSALVKNLNMSVDNSFDTPRLVIIKNRDQTVHAGVLVHEAYERVMRRNLETYTNLSFIQRLVIRIRGQVVPQNAVRATPGRSLTLPHATGMHLTRRRAGLFGFFKRDQMYASLVRCDQVRMKASTFSGQWVGSHSDDYWKMCDNIGDVANVLQADVRYNGLDFSSDFSLAPSVLELIKGAVMPANMTAAAIDSFHSLINSKAMEQRILLDSQQLNQLHAYITAMSMHVNRCTKAVQMHLDAYDSMRLDRRTTGDFIVPRMPTLSVRVSRQAMHGGGALPHPAYTIAPHAVDPIARTKPVSESVDGPELFPFSGIESIAQEFGRRLVLCGTCGRPMRIRGMYDSGFCSVCSKNTFCRQRRNGQSCGFPLAYGKCGICDSDVTASIIQCANQGTPGPVYDRIVEIPTFTTPPITALKNINGNKDSVPAPAQTFMMIEDGHTLKVVPTIFRMEQTKNKQRKVRRNVHGGPTAVGLVFPSIPLMADDCQTTKNATKNARLLACAPEPTPAAWDELWNLVDRHWDRLCPGKCPRGIKNYRTTRAVQMMRGWANSFIGEGKRRKKHNGVNNLLSRGVLPEDLVLTGMIKKELSQKHSDTFKAPSQTPALQTLHNDECVTNCSSLLCPRMLRYFGTQVVDALFGPDTCIGYKHLCKVWSGEHFVLLGAGRKNNEVGAFYDMHPQAPDRVYFTGDYSLMDLSSGAHAHAFFFKFMQKLGLYQDPLHRETFARIFPQRLKWQGEGNFVLAKGMASGAVWTTMMNTVLNAVFSTFGAFRAWLCNCGFVGSSFTMALYDQAMFTQFLENTDYHGAFAGDDSVIAMCGDHSYFKSAIGTYTKSLGYILKLQSTNQSAHADFLGCNPIRVYNLKDQRYTHTMAPQPHRFFTTFGWARSRPAHPREHAAGVAFGWNTGLGHLPVYRELCRAQRTDVGESMCAKEWGDFSRDWAHYCTYIDTNSDGLVADATTYHDLATAWNVGVHVVERLQLELSSVQQLPCYVGTASAHAIIRGSAM